MNRVRTDFLLNYCYFDCFAESTQREVICSSGSSAASRGSAVRAVPHVKPQGRPHTTAETGVQVDKHLPLCFLHSGDKFTPRKILNKR